MSEWNYRVIKRTSYGETLYAIHEVYYDDAGNITSCTENPTYPLYNSTTDGNWSLAQELGLYAAALTKPYLNYDEIGV